MIWVPEIHKKVEIEITEQCFSSFALFDLKDSISLVGLKLGEKHQKIQNSLVFRASQAWVICAETLARNFLGRIYFVRNKEAV